MGAAFESQEARRNEANKSTSVAQILIQHPLFHTKHAHGDICISVYFLSSGQIGSLLGDPFKINQ